MMLRLQQTVVPDPGLWDRYLDWHEATVDFLNSAFVTLGVILLIVGIIATFSGGGSFAGGCFVGYVFLLGIGEDAEAGFALATVIAAGKGLLGGPSVLGFVARLPAYALCALLAGSKLYLAYLAITIVVDLIGGVLPPVAAIVVSAAVSVVILVLVAVDTSARDGATFIPILCIVLALAAMGFGIDAVNERARRAST